MSEWKEVRLGDLIEVKYGKDHKKLGNGTIPVYGSGGIMRTGDLSLYDQPSVLIPRKGTLSNIFYVDTPFWTVDTMFWTKINTDRVLPKFLYYSIKDYKWDSLNVGSAVPSLTVPVIEGVSIHLPSLDTQKKIANQLSEIDSKIAVNKKICENLEAQAQALFKHWFVDFAPFKDGKFIESELGLIPEGWKTSNIYDYIDVIYGAPYKSSLFNEKKNGLPLIRIRDLKTCSPKFYTPEVLPTTEYIEAGDVVAGMDAEFIPYLWLGEKGVLNQRCCKFKGKDNRISNYYILFLVKPELEYVQSYKTGTTVSHLGKSDIDRFRVVTPPLDVILSFSDIVNPMKEEVVTRAKESRLLADLRDTLLPKLMSGEIKVNEIEKSYE